jgi:hypothetical protein
LKHGEEAEVARDVEKLLKVERLGEVPKLSLEPCEVISTVPRLDLVNIEGVTEPKMNVHIDLGLDQLEEAEE